MSTDKLKTYTTSEQVSKYHPDKYADQVSDKVVTEVTKIDPAARLAVETLVKSDNIVVAGEITTTIEEQELYNIIGNAAIDVSKSLFYFNENTNVSILITKQSTEIANAVNTNEETNKGTGAGDQGIVVGYATNESHDRLPISQSIANAIIDEINIEADQPLSMFAGDAKAQVTVVETDYGFSIDNIIVSTCVRSDYRGTLEDVNNCIKSIVHTIFEDIYVGVEFNEHTDLILNPSGLWKSGGPNTDSGLTGRKIVADQYGPSVPVGGGAFSGKDLTKVDRSAAYMARKVAKELLEKYGQGTVKEFVKIEAAYSIGYELPTMLEIETNIDTLERLIATSNLREELKQRFKVDKLITELQYLDLYELSKGSHYRSIDGILAI